MSQKVCLIRKFRYVSYIIIVISVWSCGYSKCSETNVYIEEIINCTLCQKVTSGDSRMSLLISHFWTATVLTFFKNGL